MFSRRVIFGLLLSVMALLAASVATTVLFDIPAGAGRSLLRSSFGPVSLGLLHLSESEEYATSPNPVATMTNSGTKERQFIWRNNDIEKVIGPVRVVATWSVVPPRAWLQHGSVCSYILERYGERDGVFALPGLTSLSYQNMHLCQVISKDEQRQWLYVFQVPPLRCRTAALVFALVPWKFVLEDDDSERLNSEMEKYKAAVFGSVMASLEPDALCRAAYRKLGWSLIALPSGLLVVATVLYVTVIRRAATSRASRSGRRY